MKDITLFVACALLSVGCGRSPEANEKVGDTTDQNTIALSEAQFRAASIQLGKVQNIEMSRQLQVNGVLDVPPQNAVTVSAPMGGFVKTTKLLQGMKIKKGEMLVTLENQEYIQLQQDYLDNRSKLEFLMNEYRRQQALSEENVNSQKVLQQAKAQYESARANVKGLQARLNMLNIKAEQLESGDIKSVIHLYSPIDGFVTAVNVNTGQYVDGTVAMFKIVNLEHIHLELQVYEKDIRALKAGQKVKFKLINDEETRAGSIYLLGKEISPERTVQVHCHLDQEDRSLLPGMFVTANIEIGAASANVVPADAIVNFEGQQMIFIPAGKNQFKSVNVMTGAKTNEYVEILPGKDFEIETPVVVKGAFELLGLLRNKQE